jgi:hypothetical protein
LLLVKFGYATLVEVPTDPAPEPLEPKVFLEINFDDIKPPELKSKYLNRDSVSLEK